MDKVTHCQQHNSLDSEPELGVMRLFVFFFRGFESAS